MDGAGIACLMHQDRFICLRINEGKFKITKFKLSRYAYKWSAMISPIAICVRTFVHCSSQPTLWKLAIETALQEAHQWKGALKRVWR